MHAKAVACRNTGLWPVRPAGMLAAAPGFSGVELRWAHRLKVYVPVSPDVHLLIRLAHHRTIIRQIERFLKFHRVRERALSASAHLIVEYCCG